jgi:hypothetical protein
VLLELAYKGLAPEAIELAPPDAILALGALVAVELKLHATRVAADRSLLGPILETYVFSEILKQQSWLDDASELSHSATKKRTRSILSSKPHRATSSASK